MLFIQTYIRMFVIFFFYFHLQTQLKHLQEERDRTVKELEETRAKVEQFSSYKRSVVRISCVSVCIIAYIGPHLTQNSRD